MKFKYTFQSAIIVGIGGGIMVAILLVQLGSVVVDRTSATVISTGQCAGQSPQCAFTAQGDDGTLFSFRSGKPTVIGQRIWVTRYRDRFSGDIRITDGH